MEIISKKFFSNCEDAKTWAEKVYSLSEIAYLEGSPWSKSVFEADLERNFYLFLVDEKLKLQGYLSYQNVLDEFEIQNVVVSPELQNQGYGEKLLRQLCAMVSQEKGKIIYLEVRISNKQAQHLYEKMGFEGYHRRKNYYQHPEEDALLMKKEILEAF